LIPVGSALFYGLRHGPPDVVFLSVIASSEFAIALNKTNGTDTLPWENLMQGMRFAYASSEDIQYWTRQTVAAFLSKAEEEVRPKRKSQVL
jgi:hypothetical protein